MISNWKSHTWNSVSSSIPVTLKRQERYAQRARRVLMGHKPRIFKQMDASPTLGSILVEMGALTAQELEWLLEEQAAVRRRGDQMMFGDVAVSRGKVTPETLARALMMQIQRRVSNDAAPAPWANI